MTYVIETFPNYNENKNWASDEIAFERFWTWCIRIYNFLKFKKKNINKN